MGLFWTLKAYRFSEKSLIFSQSLDDIGIFKKTGYLACSLMYKLCLFDENIPVSCGLQKVWAGVSPRSLCYILYAFLLFFVGIWLSYRQLVTYNMLPVYTPCFLLTPLLHQFIPFHAVKSNGNGNQGHFIAVV